VIAATNRDLEAAVRDGSFREDLYYRLNVIGVGIPPLRERREDILLLTTHFLEVIALELGKPIPALSQEALRMLVGYDWPGNVRELENTLERALVTSHDGILDVDDFSFLEVPANVDAGDWRIPVDVSLREVEQKVIQLTLERAGGNVKHSAEVLGIDRSTLYDKMERYGLRRPESHVGSDPS
jgi:DNA-binding NtrC family response regulator